MSLHSPVVLVATSSDGAVEDVTAPLADAGYEVVSRPIPRNTNVHGLPPVRESIVLVLVDSPPELAAAFTRQIRAESHSPPPPILWLLTTDTISAATLGLDSGADVCLVRTVDGDLLVSQVGALLRARNTLSRFAGKRADGPEPNDRVQKLYQTAEASAVLARKMAAEFAPQEAIRAADLASGWFVRSANQGGVSMFDVSTGPNGTMHLALVEVGGLGPAVGAALASTTVRSLLRESLSRLPNVVLNTTNRRLCTLGLPETAVVSAVVATVQAESGQVAVSCAGLPSPVFLPTTGPASVWHGSGPFLASADATFHDTTGLLKPGEKLVLIAGGALADRRPDVRVASETHRTLAAQPFAEAVAGELLADADPDDGFILLTVERTAG